MILDHTEQFIDRTMTRLGELGIEVTGFDMDHIGYQASSDKDYDELCSEFNTFAKRVSEEIVGGRRVGIYELHEPLKFEGYIIPAIELVAPKAGQQCHSSLEHVEFVIKETFESFMSKYPNVAWDVSSIDQKDFPMIKLRFDENTQVKFHIKPVLSIVASKRLNSRVGVGVVREKYVISKKIKS
ncbi:hypothetical protein COY32_00925 [candidate division WWE3 bacterium CG_4_10_14_0_2_um_filter_41_14]|uniref:VOC domain-containing protein n=1 Tax=candidate division WWE3 bacterium CG_4_10_14_0_2_um_filter_41_14 TaxID=1975072 RepID=A0A2M7TLG0_UNCKA|nr:MAG: hypothetical protein COY32_00925 [candidate division WWE3 bacterium CG_4_10_14_0_2_um_filter_41_14]